MKSEKQNTESGGVIKSKNTITAVYGKDNICIGENSVISTYGKGYTDINELQEDHSRIQENPLALLDVLKKNKEVDNTDQNKQPIHQVMKKFLGYILVSSPVIAFIVLLYLSHGIEGVITVLVYVAIIVALICLGAYLIKDE